jgi:hypothetical protein
MNNTKETHLKRQFDGKRSNDMVNNRDSFLKPVSRLEGVIGR